MLIKALSEASTVSSDLKETRLILEKFERAKILEVYFSRLDGRMPQNIPSDYHELFELDLEDIKNFLLGQHPQDSLLQKIFRMIS